MFSDDPPVNMNDIWLMDTPPGIFISRKHLGNDESELATMVWVVPDIEVDKDASRFELINKSILVLESLFSSK